MMARTREELIEIFKIAEARFECADGHTNHTIYEAILFLLKQSAGPKPEDDLQIEIDAAMANWPPERRQR